MELFKAIREATLKADIDIRWKEFIETDRPVIIYGAGKQARVVIDFCKMYQKEIFCLMTTDSRARWGLVPREDEMPLYLIHEFPAEYAKSQYDVIIALNSRYNDEITALLEKQGFTNIFGIQDWGKENLIIRDVYYRTYFQFKGAVFKLDETGEEYLEYPYGKHGLKMYFPKEKIFKANLLGELGNIVMPSIFNDELVSCLGPYEYQDNIRMKEGGVVFDLGASVGLFSCVAAAKGCKVYAFEPKGIPMYDYLEKTVSLNKAITIVPYAVGAKNGIINFYYNDCPETDHDMCQSSIHSDLNPAYRKTQVEMITLDWFVKENAITQVDFIKSHIEYAEEYMLEGAQEVLRTFNPVLSFYSQKALGNDRYKQVEKWIKKANPEYQISYYKRRVYAYVP